MRPCGERRLHPPLLPRGLRAPKPLHASRDPAIQPGRGHPPDAHPANRRPGDLPLRGSARAEEHPRGLRHPRGTRRHRTRGGRRRGCPLASHRSGTPDGPAAAGPPDLPDGSRGREGRLPSRDSRHCRGAKHPGPTGAACRKGEGGRRRPGPFREPPVGLPHPADPLGTLHRKCAGRKVPGPAQAVLQGPLPLLPTDEGVARRPQPDPGDRRGGNRRAKGKATGKDNRQRPPGPVRPDPPRGAERLPLEHRREKGKERLQRNGRPPGRDLSRFRPLQPRRRLDRGGGGRGDDPALCPHGRQYRPGLARGPRRQPLPSHVLQSPVGPPARRGDGHRARQPLRPRHRRGAPRVLRPHRPRGGGTGVHPRGPRAGRDRQATGIPRAQSRSHRSGAGYGKQAPEAHPACNGRCPGRLLRGAPPGRLRRSDPAEADPRPGKRLVSPDDRGGRAPAGARPRGARALPRCPPLGPADAAVELPVQPGRCRRRGDPQAAGQCAHRPQARGP